MIINEVVFNPNTCEVFAPGQMSTIEFCGHDIPAEIQIIGALVKRLGGSVTLTREETEAIINVTGQYAYTGSDMVLTAE